ncbi:calcium-binding protein [Sphingomonas sp. LY54]|uniref:calcium-binding protein n=1 Tax=Sphingomonas sp. LY54 TaxID=3095343 RepID=UPI002D781553|nr:calcium-binding protein [Sphingomonas sp. LY54]WRP28217.1 calcium-binding protein [Sphingomonas sp. LY54]
MSDITGTDGNDDLTGTPGDDRMRGGGGDDRIRGGEGDDEISGGGGNDDISGGQGNDTIRGGHGNDDINGGEGFDRAVYEGDVSEYDIFVDDQGRLHINDQVVDRDGNDRVKEVEEFNFNGEIYTYAELLAL